MESGSAVRSESIEIAPITAVPWADVERVFGARGDPAGCWCQYFKMPNARWREAPAGEKAGLLRRQTEAGDPAPGLIAYLDGEPVGWCAVEPRTRYPRILNSTVAADSDEAMATRWTRPRGRSRAQPTSTTAPCRSSRRPASKSCRGRLRAVLWCDWISADRGQ